MITTLRATNERLRAALDRVNQECDAVMVLADGETPETLTGYGRGAYFTARHIKKFAAQEA
jgi:hypothetical protein